MGRRLNRRAVLRGLGGVGVALPALEIMGLTDVLGSRKSQAQAGPPARFLNSYAGVAIGSDVTAHGGDILIVPDTEGANYELRPAIEPLGELGIHSKVSVVTNLVIPWQTRGDGVPPGGRGTRKNGTTHHRTWPNQTCGLTIHDENYDDSRIPLADLISLPSCDQIAAQHLGGNTLHRVLPYKLQANKNFAFSWRPSDNGVDPVEPITSPRLAYESLFAGFTPMSADPIDNERARMALRRRLSVLDLVRDNTERLMPRLSRWDRQRIDQHFQSIREVEVKLQRLEGTPTQGGAMCALPGRPPSDPEVDNSNKGAWSNEDQRSEVLSDLIAAAFACDLTRSVPYLLTESKCYLPLRQLSDGRFGGECHTQTHRNGNQRALSTAVSWMVRQWGMVLQKLDQLPEVDGSTVLDHTAAVLYFESGHGFNPQDGARGKSHSSENMAVLIGGGAKLGLVQGHHINGRERHPGRVVLSAMNAVGVPDETFGDIPGGPISELHT